MLCIGTLLVTVNKLMDEVVVGKDKDGKEKVFNHPYFQCGLMFIGEVLCLGIFALKSAIWGKGVKEGFKKQIAERHPIWMAIPGSCDLCGSSCLLLAMTMCAASVY